ncbi:uncharacterized protein LOC110635255 isoform X3 [Hevea brasiliensis]|uniref:uncharacterized protein LOC110635255 isoform X3 n=1 Tax=Hevea brasiliensis TaxID=3981 RepID=UPI0025D26EE8|nr:uncharacterized protein LOC110635255 isoform X3 [Hevea brasiliensis]
MLVLFLQLLPCSSLAVTSASQPILIMHWVLQGQEFSDLHGSTHSFCRSPTMDESPGYYVVQIHNFGELKNAMKKYESAVFEAEGCKWKLVLYPSGNKTKHVNRHISFYLALADSVEHEDEEVYAVFCLYLLDQQNHNDLIAPGPGIFSQSLLCKEINFTFY